MQYSERTSNFWDRCVESNYVNFLVLAAYGLTSYCFGLFSLAGIAALVENGSWGFLGHIGIMGGFALLLTYGAFFAEAGKAKNLISQVILEIHKEAANKELNPTTEGAPSVEG